LGKLQEIDLGLDAKLRNIERTEAATRRLEGGEIVEGEETRNRGKIRLGRDGKPWRGRKRRNSEDIKRDKLVEEVLKETRRRSPLSCHSLTASPLTHWLQSIYTTSRTRRQTRMMTRLPTIASRSSSAASSWTPSRTRILGKLHLHHQVLLEASRARIGLKARSLVGVGARGRRCGQRRMRRRRDRVRRGAMLMMYEEW